MRKKLQKLLVILPVLILVLCSSCASTRPQSVGPWPTIDVPVAVALTAQETAVLTEFSDKHPELARKIIAHTNELVALLRSYNKSAIEHNMKALEELGFKREQLGDIGPAPK